MNLWLNGGGGAQGICHYAICEIDCGVVDLPWIYG